MLEAVERLRILTDHYEGLGVPLNVAARYMHCHPTTLGKYISDQLTPSVRLEQQIIEGLDEMCKFMREKVEVHNSDEALPDDN